MVTAQLHRQGSSRAPRIPDTGHTRKPFAARPHRGMKQRRRRCAAIWLGDAFAPPETSSASLRWRYADFTAPRSIETATGPRDPSSDAEPSRRPWRPQLKRSNIRPHANLDRQPASLSRRSAATEQTRLGARGSESLRLQPGDPQLKRSSRPGSPCSHLSRTHRADGLYEHRDPIARPCRRAAGCVEVRSGGRGLCRLAIRTPRSMSQRQRWVGSRTWKGLPRRSR